MSLASLEFEEVEQFTRAFEALFNAGDAAGMASYYAEDARLLAEHADLVHGRGAIERFWREAISRARAVDALRTIRLDEVTSSGDLGYALGVVVVRIPSGPELTTKYATIWQRDPRRPVAARGRLVQPEPLGRAGRVIAVSSSGCAGSVRRRRRWCLVRPRRTARHRRRCCRCACCRTPRGTGHRLWPG